MGRASPFRRTVRVGGRVESHCDVLTLLVQHVGALLRRYEVAEVYQVSLSLFLRLPVRLHHPQRLPEEGDGVVTSVL